MIITREKSVATAAKLSAPAARMLLELYEEMRHTNDLPLRANFVAGAYQRKALAELLRLKLVYRWLGNQEDKLGIAPLGASVSVYVPTLSLRFSSLRVLAELAQTLEKDDRPLRVVNNALANARDTLGEDPTLREGTERFWELALGSIQCVIEAHCWHDMFAWFNREGARVGFAI